MAPQPTPRLGPVPASRGLFLVATDVVGRVSVLAGPYVSVDDAAEQVGAVAESLAGLPALAGFGHVTIAEGAGGSATFFGRV